MEHLINKYWGILLPIVCIALLELFAGDIFNYDAARSFWIYILVVDLLKRLAPRIGTLGFHDTVTSAVMLELFQFMLFIPAVGFTSYVIYQFLEMKKLI